MANYWQKYKWPIIGGGLGLLIAILILTLGFFKTLIILLFMLIGIGLAWYLQQSNFFNKLLKSWR